MSIKDAFTDDEWFLLSSMPGMVGAAMANAAPSGVIGTVKEMTAGMRASVRGLEDYPDSELISELLEKAENWDEAKEKMADYRQRTQARMQDRSVQNRDELQGLVLEDCRTAAALVDERCSVDEATAYKQWTVTLARTVAEAAKEGSILGFGGERISEPERALLKNIENALGVQPGELFA